MAIDRWAKFYDLTMYSTHPDREPFDIVNIMKELKKSIDNAKDDSGKPTKIFDGGKKTIRLSDLKICDKKNIAFLLLKLTDSTQPNVTKSKLAGGQSKTFYKNKDEGYDTTAHLAVSLDGMNIDDGGLNYPMVIEEAKHLSKSTVSPAIRTFIKEITACEEYCKKLKKDIKWHTIADLISHPSSEFKKLLETGTILGATFFMNKVNDNIFDTEAILKKEEKTMKVTVNHKCKADTNAIVKLIRERGAESKFDKLRMHFKLPNSNKQTSAEMLVRTEDYADATFTKVERINAPAKEITAEDKLSEHVMECMSKMIA